MTIEDIIRLRDNGEQTTVQFKERISAANKYDIGCEMVALSNTQGGIIIIGINDKTGALNPLSYTEIQETTAILGNVASENVVPAILITTEKSNVLGTTSTVSRYKMQIYGTNQLMKFQTL